MYGTAPLAALLLDVAEMHDGAASRGASYPSLAGEWGGHYGASSWTLKDTLLYAVSVGARPPQDLRYLYEKHGPAVLPTFPTRLAGVALLEFVSHLQRVAPNPTLLASTDLQLLHSIPVECAQVESHAHLKQMWRQGGHLFLDLEVRSFVGAEPLSVVTHTIRARGAASDEVAVGQAEAVMDGDRAAALSFDDDVRPEQYAIWRLQERLSLEEPLADEIHFDPEFTAAHNLGAPFITGECALGFMARAGLRMLGRTAEDHVKRVGASFRSKVLPSDRLTTFLWREDERRATLEVVNQDGVVVLGNGYIELSA